MRLFFILGLFLTTNLNAGEQTIEIHEYAKGLELITNTRAAIYKIQLPEDVYKNITRKDLGDIRVFNHGYEAVPHVIGDLIVHQANPHESLSLPFFPIANDAIDNNQSGLDIIVATDGKIVQIQSADDQYHTHDSEYYLIDASRVDYPIDSIDLDIKRNVEGYAKKIKLEYSQDLNHWVTLVNQATLTDLDYGDHVLKNTHVILPNKKAKYLRLIWLDESDDLVIDGIKANLNSQHHSIQQNWSTASLINTSENPKSYEFDTGGIFTIRQINIELPDDNTLIDVKIKSRDDMKTKWVTQYKGVFYKLKMKDTEVMSNPINIRPINHRYWQVELESRDGMGKSAPIFNYAWNANELYFLARGEPPFILAYGNASINDVYKPPATLLNIIKQDSKTGMVAEAFAGQEILFKGESALKVKQELPWQRIILWVVLVMGVFVTGFMVFRLSRQMGLMQK